MFDPGEEGERLHFLWATSQSFTFSYNQILDFLNISNCFIRQWYFQLGDHGFRWRKFGCIRWEWEQEDIGRDSEFLAHMPSCLVEQKHNNLTTLGINSSTELFQSDLHQGDVDAGQDQEFALPRLRLNENIGVEPFITAALSNHRTLALKRPEALQYRLQAKTPFILYPKTNLLLRVRGLRNSQRRFDFFMNSPCSSGEAASVCVGRGT